MTSAMLRAVAPVRVFQRLRDAVARVAARSLPPELPSHEQLRELREYKRYVAAAPHVLAVGGRLDIIRIPR
jgi:hypothetical protein